MPKGFSLYLDAVRFLAAVAVFLSHVPYVVDGMLWQLAGLGHEAVVVFFVLSGFVIAYVCAGRGESAREYVIHRSLRIYSVALPAMLLTVVTYALIMHYNPSSLAAIAPNFKPLVPTLWYGLTFTNQSWQEIGILTNLAYWSMGYEVLYYLLFGVCFYLRGWRRYGYACVVLLLMGPSILLYLPVWLAGVVLYYICQTPARASIAKYQLWCLLLISSLLIVLLCQHGLQTWLNDRVLAWLGTDISRFILPTADAFASDYLLTLAVVLHFYAIYQLCVFAAQVTPSNNLISTHPPTAPQTAPWLQRCWQRILPWIPRLAAHTFSLYLLHMPLLYLVLAFTPYQRFGLLSLVAVALVPLLIYAISVPIETQRRYWQQRLSHNAR